MDDFRSTFKEPFNYSKNGRSERILAVYKKVGFIISKALGL